MSFIGKVYVNFFQCFCAVTLFYCAHWQTYVSGTLHFGRIDVTEAQYIIIAIQLISATFGSSVWSTKVVLTSAQSLHHFPYLTGACRFEKNPSIALINHVSHENVACHSENNRRFTADWILKSSGAARARSESISLHPIIHVETKHLPTLPGRFLF